MAVQSCAMRALRPSISSQDREAQIWLKVKITFGNDFWTTTVLDHGWWHQLESLLSNVKPHLRVCWLRTISGGWTTSIRMHDDVTLQCIFGCQYGRLHVALSYLSDSVAAGYSAS